MTLLIVAGLFVSMGLDRALQIWVADKFPALAAFEQGLIPQSDVASGVVDNVEQR